MSFSINPQNRRTLQNQPFTPHTTRQGRPAAIRREAHRRPELIRDPASLFKRQFGDLAQSKTKFHATLKQVFGDAYNRVAAEAFRGAALHGRFGWLPPVKLVDAATLGGANGAYDTANNVIYLNRAVATGNPSRAAQTFVEEAGHFLDAKLNRADSAGDEGELFRRVVAGEVLTSAQVKAIRAENDHGTIRVDGRNVDVEFWGWSSVKKAAKKVGRKVKKTAKKVGHKVKSAAKKVGSKINYAAKKTWGGIKTGARYTWRGAKWAGRSVYNSTRQLGYGVWNTTKSVAHGVVEGAKTGWKGVKQIARGDIKAGLKNIGRGLGKATLQNAVDGLIIGGGHAIGAVQTLVGLEKHGRKLSAQETAMLRPIFGNSIDLGRVRIKEGFAGIYSLNDRPFVMGDTIYMKDWAGKTGHARSVLLVHEMMHVWQHQNGGGDYATEAIYTEQRYGQDKAYGFEAPVDAGVPFERLKVEQQATLIEKAFEAGYFTSGTFMHNGKDYTAYVDRAVAMVRDGKGAP
ncbi:MAG: hypothetical protein AAF333_05120 [Planctomycetota bacterium]